jgi:Protein of unknown function (DUF3043)
VASLFRRKSAELVEETEPEAAPEPEPETRRPKGYTPSKKELGVSTPKRPIGNVRRPGTDVPRARGSLTKEERREVREERRARRREVTEGMRRGDERYLSARDKGPARALARDIVDSRRTIGTWFFGGALIVLFGSSAAMPPAIRLAANLAWGLLAVAVIFDSFLLCRKLKRLLAERHPDSTERRGSLYLYVVMRSITFRRLRIPQPRLKPGDKV